MKNSNGVLKQNTQHLPLCCNIVPDGTPGIPNIPTQQRHGIQHQSISTVPSRPCGCYLGRTMSVQTRMFWRPLSVSGTRWHEIFMLLLFVLFLCRTFSKKREPFQYRFKTILTVLDFLGFAFVFILLIYVGIVFEWHHNMHQIHPVIESNEYTKSLYSC